MAASTISRDEATRTSIGRVPVGQSFYRLRSGKLHLWGEMISLRRSDGGGYDVTIRRADGEERTEYHGAPTSVYLPNAPQPEDEPVAEEEAPAGSGHVEIAEQAKLDEEIAGLRREQQTEDEAGFALSPEVTKAADRAERTGKPEDQQAWEKLHAQLMRHINAGIRISEKLSVLTDPAELERRVNDKTHTTERITKMTDKANTTKTSKPKAADLGVPAAYVNSETGTFKVGMDARLKSDLILAILEQPAPKALVKFSKSDAETLFAKFPQWAQFLDRKRDIIAAKVAKAAEAKATKAADAKDSAAAKRATSTKANGGAKPDPKPTGKRGNTAKQRAAAAKS